MVLPSICPKYAPKLMAGNHMRSLGADRLPVAQSGRAEAITIKTAGKIHRITDKNKYCLPECVLIPSLSPCLSPVCLLFINDVCVSLADSYPRGEYHTELRSAFDVQLITKE